VGGAMATDSAADVQCIGPVTAAEVRGHVVPIVPGRRDIYGDREATHD